MPGNSVSTPRRTLIACLVLLVALHLAACAAPVPGGRLTAPATNGVSAQPGSTPTPPPFTPEPPHAPGVADLLTSRPADGQTVEVDAYFSAAGAPTWPGGGPPPPRDDTVWCPPTWPYTLTDRPYPVALAYLNTTTSNNLPDDAPWLIAALPEQTQPNARALPQLPYHARLAGHFGDPAFSGLDCQHGDRVFVVEHVVRVYQQVAPDALYDLAVPADYAAWPRYDDPAQGYSVPYPPDWLIQPQDDGALALRGPQWPGHAVLMRVHASELNYDQYDPANAPPPLRDVDGWSQFQQGGWPYDQVTPPTQGLTGFVVQRKAASATERPVAVLFSGGGRTHEISLSYPTGFAASPQLLRDYTGIVQGFRLDEAPGPTATPPIRQTLGPGPFLTEEQAFQKARERAESPLENLSGGELLSEAAARQLVVNSPCNTFTGHPEGVWVLRVSGQFEGRAMQLRLLLDAVTGEQLCGEEIVAGN